MAEHSSLERLSQHRKGLQNHFRKASDSLVKCQIIEPYVEKGTLHGCICPWEIGASANQGNFPILEDFHDTLEAIWVWTYYTGVSGKQAFKPNIDWAWEYIVNNWKRFIGKGKKEDRSLYDCSYVLFSGDFYADVFKDDKYKRLIIQAGNCLETHLSRLKSTEGREYSDPFWMAYCLGLAAKSLKRETWIKTAQTYVHNNVVKVKSPFSKAEKEPNHTGPNGHDFFSKNANKALALISCLSQESATKEITVEKFLPSLPKEFVSRKADENAWNAHLAASIGKSYAFTRSKEFLSPYFAIMDELKVRDVKKSAALPRSPSFPRRESWVIFFYAHAYASICRLKVKL
jgi:hypothetical protein